MSPTIDVAAVGACISGFRVFAPRPGPSIVTARGLHLSSYSGSCAGVLAASPVAVDAFRQGASKGRTVFSTGTCILELGRQDSPAYLPA